MYIILLSSEKEGTSKAQLLYRSNNERPFQNTMGRNCVDLGTRLGPKSQSSELYESKRGKQVL